MHHSSFRIVVAKIWIGERINTSRSWVALSVCIHVYVYVCVHMCAYTAGTGEESGKNGIMFSSIVTVRRVFHCCGACLDSELLDLLVSVSPTLGSWEHAAAWGFLWVYCWMFTTGCSPPTPSLSLFLILGHLSISKVVLSKKNKTQAKKAHITYQ